MSCTGYRKRFDTQPQPSVQPRYVHDVPHDSVSLVGHLSGGLCVFSGDGVCKRRPYFVTGSGSTGSHSDLVVRPLATLPPHDHLWSVADACPPSTIRTLVPHLSQPLSRSRFCALFAGSGQVPHWVGVFSVGVLRTLLCGFAGMAGALCCLLLFVVRPQACQAGGSSGPHDQFLSVYFLSYECV